MEIRDVLPYALFLGGALASAYLWSEAAKSPVIKTHIILDMTVPMVNERPWAVSLFVNTLEKEPASVTAKPGVRARYDFPIDVPKISFLRLDPVNVLGVEVAIHSLVIEHQGTVLRSFGPDELAKWGRNLPLGARLSNGSFYLAGVGTDVNHIVGTFPAVAIPASPFWEMNWRAMIPAGWSGRLLMILVFAIVLLIVLNTLTEFNPAQLLLLFTSALTVVVGTYLVHLLPGRPFETSIAVGRSSYVGYPKTLDVLMMLPLLAASVIGAVIASVFTSRALFVRNWLGTAYRKPRALFSNTATHAAILSLVVAAIPIYYLWGAEYFYKFSRREDLPPIGWDSGNLMLWQYLVQHGSLPYKDFWYPYGGQIFGYLSFPLGTIYARLVGTTIFVLSLFSFYLVTNRSLLRTLAIFGLWLGMFHHGVFIVGRYAVAVPIIASYVCVSYETRRIGWSRVLFWMAVAASFFDDVLMLVYSGIPIFFLLCLEGVRDRRQFFRQLPMRVLRDFLVPALMLSGFLVWMAWHGQLHGLLDFYRDLSALTAYAANPVSLTPWLTMEPIDRGFFMWSGVVLLGFGIFLYLTDSAERHKVSLLILLLGLCDLILFYKQLVHADSTFGWLSIPAAGCLFFLFGRGDALNRVQQLSLWAVAGLFMGVFWRSDALTEFSKRVSLSIMKGNLEALSIGSQERARVLEQSWDLKRFKQQGDLLTILEAVKPRLEPGNLSSLFTLTDAQLLYVMARQNPPYYFSLYDGSSLEGQKKVVGWLGQKRPKVVFVDTNIRDVYGVPAIVRDPLTYQHVILNYVLDTRVGHYAILRPRKPEESIDFEFWQGIAGTVDLGHLPRYSNIGRFKPCTSTLQGCSEFLLVKPKVPVLVPTPANFTIIANGNRFSLHFTLVPEQQEYAVFLDHLWFWGGLRQAGLSPAFAELDPRLDVEVVRRARRTDILY